MGKPDWGQVGHRQNRSHRPGQALVEFALITTALSILLLGVIELVTMYNTKGYLTNASRSGVRLASLAYDDISIANSVWVELNGHGLMTPAGPGGCDVHELDIYKATTGGSPATPGPGYNGPDQLYTTIEGGVCRFWIQDYYDQYGASSAPCGVGGTVEPLYLCYDQQHGPDVFGFPLSQRHAQLAAPATTSHPSPPLVGVQIVYTYHYRTPIISRLGGTTTFTFHDVQALGGDNANDLLNVLTATPVATFTPSNTPTNTATSTNTPTSTSTPTSTNTPTNTGTPTNTATPTITYTPISCSPACIATDSPTPSQTDTPTQTSTPTSTPTQTSTPTSTPTPLPPAVSEVIHPVCSVGTESGNGISVNWNGVAGAISYQVLYVNPPNNPILVGVVPAGSPGSGGTYPPIPPFYYTVAAGSYFEVSAVYSSSYTGPPGIPTPFSSACAPQTS